MKGFLIGKTILFDQCRFPWQFLAIASLLVVLTGCQFPFGGAAPAVATQPPSEVATETISAPTPGMYPGAGATGNALPAATSAPYPAPGEPGDALPTATSGPYPAPADTLAVPATPNLAYPAPAQSTDIPTTSAASTAVSAAQTSATPTASATVTTAAGATSTFAPTPSPTTNLYPGPQIQATFDPYPGITTPGAFPSATPTATGGAGLFPQPTATPQLFPTASATAGPSPTPTATPTPVFTPTPTPTQTPIPLPPWVRSKLRASDPNKVVLASGKVQLIEFFAFWSGPSQAMAPLVHGLQTRYEKRMNFIYLDVDDPRTSGLRKALGYKLQPQFFLLDANGRLLSQWSGYVSVSDLTLAIEAALK